MKKSANIKVLGKVQGVNLRYNTQVAAKQMGITGFVKNMEDGSVFIEAEGEETDLEKFIDWCHKGPSSAWVKDLKVDYKPVSGHDKFQIRY